MLTRPRATTPWPWLPARRKDSRGPRRYPPDRIQLARRGYLLIVVGLSRKMAGGLRCGYARATQVTSTTRARQVEPSAAADGQHTPYRPWAPSVDYLALSAFVALGRASPIDADL